MRTTKGKPPKNLKQKNHEKRWVAALSIKSARARDRESANKAPFNAGWGVSFDAHINQLLFFYRKNLYREINGHRKLNPRDYTVLEIGCGGGTAANDLALDRLHQLGKPVKVIATGTALNKLWKRYPKHVDFRVAHTGQLSRKFPSASINFIHSNLGIGNVHDTSEALAQCHKILRKKGRLLFTAEHAILIPRELYKILSIEEFGIPGRPTVRIVAHYLEKK